MSSFCLKQNIRDYRILARIFTPPNPGSHATRKLTRKKDDIPSSKSDVEVTGSRKSLANPQGDKDVTLPPDKKFCFTVVGKVTCTPLLL